MSLFSRTNQGHKIAAAEAPVSWWDGWVAAFDRTVQIDNAFKREEILRHQEFERHRQIVGVMGNNFPMAASFSGVRFDQSRLNQSRNMDGRVISNSDYENWVEDARAENPEGFKNIETRQQFDERLGRQIQHKRNEFDNIIERSGHPILANIMGGIAGSFVDPVNIGAMILTEGGSAAKTIGGAVIKGAGVNAAAEAATVPIRWHETNDIERMKYDFGDAAFDVGAAAFFGGLIDGAGNIISRTFKAVTGKIKLINNSEELVNEVMQESPMAREVRIEGIEEPEIRGAMREANVAIENAILTEDFDPNEQRLLGDNLALNEIEAQLGNPLTPAPPVLVNEAIVSIDEMFANALPIDKSERQPNVNLLPSFSDVDATDVKIVDIFAVSEKSAPNEVNAPEVALEQNFTGLSHEIDYRGRKAYKGIFNPLEVETAPKLFQYKEGGDERGVTDRLRNVRKWDPVSSGKAIIWENVDGKRFVADGHQRRGLAARLFKRGDETAVLDGYLFREADGWEAIDVKIIAAEKNIREGSGSALDAAKIFREAPKSVKDGSIPISGGVAREGAALAQLEPEAFGAIVNKVYDLEDGVLVGEMAANKTVLHSSLLAELKKGKYTKVGEKRLMIGKLLEHKWARIDEGSQSEMFDLKSLIPEFFHEKNKILNAAIIGIKRDARVFETILNKSDLLENQGNIIARDANEVESRELHAAMQWILRIADDAGPVKDALDAAARRLKAGGKIPNLIEPIIKATRDITQGKTDLQIMKEASAPDITLRENLQARADAPQRFEDLDENIVPIEKDDLTKDMFGDFVEPQKNIEAAEKDLQAVSVCVPKG